MSSASSLDDSPVRWDVAILYAIGIAGYALVATVPVALGLSSRMVTVPFRAVVLALSVWTLIRSAARNELYQGALWFPLTVFWVLYLGRIAWDTLLDPVPLGQPPSEYFVYGVGTCLIPMLALFSTPSRATLRLGFRLTLVSCVLAGLAVLAIGARALFSGDFSTIASGRFELATLNPIAFGHVGASMATLALLEFQSRTSAGIRTKLWLLGAAGLGVLCTGISASKGPLVAITMNIALLIVLDWRSGRPVRAMAAAVVIPLLGVQAALLLERSLGFLIVSRVLLVSDETLRIELLRGAWKQFLASPIAGSSLDERVWLTYPHNTFVESFMAVGIIGGLAYSIFHVAAVRSAVRLLLSEPGAAWLSVLCFQYSISALFSGGLYGNSAMWGLLAAVVAAQKRSPAPSRALSFGEPAAFPDVPGRA